MPDEALWRAGYRTVAADVPGVAEKTLDEALPLAKRYIDPILAREVTSGVWDPATLARQQVTAT